MIARRGKICLSAVGASVAVHLALLGGFVSVHISAPAESKPTLGAVSVQTMERHIEEPLITPKPEVKTEDKPVVQEVKPTEEIPQVVDPPVAEEIPVQPQPQSQPVVAPVKETVPVSSTETAAVSGAEFFGQETAAATVCFVVDCSGSMYGRRELIGRQLKECIASLRDTQSFYLIFFMDGDKLLENGEGRAVLASGYAKAKAFTMIDHIHLEGRTNARQALERAMKIRDGIGRPVQLIYFLTDGFDLEECSQQSFCRDIQRLRNRNAPSTVIHTIGLWTQLQDEKILQTIAEATGGQFIHVE
ncbi:MAG: hypothetical protein FJ263_06140 [Planctomycetes bacterium]|nr:hypothetical protein [Planctomycetota bacterium]